MITQCKKAKTTGPASQKHKTIVINNYNNNNNNEIVTAYFLFYV